MYFENDILPSSLPDDTLSSSEIVEKIERMKQDKFIKAKYHNKIKTRKDGRQFYVIIDRRQITSTTLNGLYEKLWELEFGRQNATLSIVYPEWLIWKRDNTSVSTKTLKEYTFIWKKFFEGLPLIEIPMKNLTAKDFLIFFRELTKDRGMTKKMFTNMKSL